MGSGGFYCGAFSSRSAKVIANALRTFAIVSISPTLRAWVAGSNPVIPTNGGFRQPISSPAVTRLVESRGQVGAESPCGVRRVVCLGYCVNDDDTARTCHDHLFDVFIDRYPLRHTMARFGSSLTLTEQAALCRRNLRRCARNDQTGSAPSLIPRANFDDSERSHGVLTVRPCDWEVLCQVTLRDRNYPWRRRKPRNGCGQTTRCRRSLRRTCTCGCGRAEPRLT